MKSAKGVTLMSLMVYVAIFLVVIGVIANTSSFFYKNITIMDSESTSDYEYNKLNLYILEETKKKGNSIVSITENSVEFSSGDIFIKEKDSNKIYFIEQNLDTTIMLCDNVQACKFETKNENGKEILKVSVTFTSENYEGKEYSTTYVLDYSNEYVEVQQNDEYIAK